MNKEKKEKEEEPRDNGGRENFALLSPCYQQNNYSIPYYHLNVTY
jgi:hypothetical protein